MVTNDNECGAIATMRLNRLAIFIALLMALASGAVIVLKPKTRVADVAPFSLNAMIPRQFGDWREEPQHQLQIVDPQAQAYLDSLYSQIVTRTYVNSQGYRIMLSVAYGPDQRRGLQVHKPEVCYPAQGFTLLRNERGEVVTSLGTIHARRLFTTLGVRNEPVTYWFTTGDIVVESAVQKRLADLKYGLTGMIPDGMIFRVSSIDADQQRANKYQDAFVDALLKSVSPADRKRLAGL